jgi:hypothetical protein
MQARAQLAAKVVPISPLPVPASVIDEYGELARKVAVFNQPGATEDYKMGAVSQLD